MINNPNSAYLGEALLARKGEAFPSPAVGYVSVRQLQGKPVKLVFDTSDETTAAAETDHVQSPLSSLIRRHRIAQAPTFGPVPETAATTATEPPPAERRPPMIDLMCYLSLPSSHDVRPDPSAAEADSVAPERVRNRNRKQLTLRLDYHKFEHLRDVAENAHATYQSILEAAVMAHLGQTARIGRRSPGHERDVRRTANHHSGSPAAVRRYHLFRRWRLPVSPRSLLAKIREYLP